MESLEVLETLTLSAVDQWGIITTAQAAREGITRLHIGRLTKRGTISRDRQGVYVLPSAQFGPHFGVQAAWVSLDPKHFPHERWSLPNNVVASHETAAALHQIGDLIPTEHTFSSPTRKQTSHKDIKIYQNRDLPAEDVTDIDGLPVTTLERTVEDLANKKVEFDHLADIVADALSHAEVSAVTLARRLDQAAHFYGYPNGRLLLDACKEKTATIDQQTSDALARLVRRHNIGALEAWTKQAAVAKSIDSTYPGSASLLPLASATLLSQFSEASTALSGNSNLSEAIRAMLSPSIPPPLDNVSTPKKKTRSRASNRASILPTERKDD